MNFSSGLFYRTTQLYTQQASATFNNIHLSSTTTARENLIQKFVFLNSNRKNCFPDLTKLNFYPQVSKNEIKSAVNPTPKGRND